MCCVLCLVLFLIPLHRTRVLNHIHVRLIRVLEGLLRVNCISTLFSNLLIHLLFIHSVVWALSHMFKRVQSEIDLLKTYNLIGKT